MTELGRNDLFPNNSVNCLKMTRTVSLRTLFENGSKPVALVPSNVDKKTLDHFISANSNEDGFRFKLAGPILVK